MHKLMVPELKLRVLDELNERDEKSPGVRSVYNQSLQQDPKTIKELHYTCIKFFLFHPPQVCTAATKSTFCHYVTIVTA